MNRTLLLCALLVALTSGAILAGLAPAHLDVLGAFRAPNPCFGSGQYCDDGDPTTYDFECVEAPLDSCPVAPICVPVVYHGQDGNDYHYCACTAVSGTPPNPKNQASWPCGTVFKVDGGGTPQGATCHNGSGECAGSQTCHDVDNGAACVFCDCG